MFQQLFNMLMVFLTMITEIRFYNNDWTFIPYEAMQARLFDYIILMAAFICMNLFLYALIYGLFLLFSPLTLNSLETRHKTLYTLKNLSKSMVLCFIVFAAMPVIWNVIMYDRWDNAIMFILGTLYTSTDLTGILIVPGLAPDTVKHHIIVCILGTLSAFSDYRVKGLHQALLALTYLSAVPYIVNTYLGLRHLSNPIGRRLQDRMVSACFYMYTISILLNFWIQHMYVYYLIPGGLTVIKMVYQSFYYVILKDDIHLMGYFRYKNQPIC
jgi:hypothetical protein